MRKLPVYKNPGVYGPWRTWFPVLVWHTCEKCKQSIIFERMHHAITGPYYNKQGIRRWLCCFCASNKIDAYHYFHQTQGWRPKRPSPPGGQSNA